MLQFHQFELSGLRILQGRSRASNLELGALNNEVKAHLTDDLVEDDTASNSTLALLEHQIDVPQTCATPSSSVLREIRARLLRLELLRFGGTVTRWQHLGTCFGTQCMRTRSCATRIHHLISLLDESAAQAVAGIQVTDYRYNNALKILKRRFGNIKMIEHKYLGEFANAQTRQLIQQSACFAQAFGHRTEQEGTA